MKIFKLILICLLLVNACEIKGQPGSYVKIRASVSREEMLQWQAENLLPSHFHYKNGVVEMELDSVELAIFRKRGVPYDDITGNVQLQVASEQNYSFLQEQRTASVPANFSYGSMGGYYTYQETMNVLDSMRARFPQLVSKKDTIGFTYGGRPIVAIRISDNPDLDESNEDEWLMTALHHANEVLGVHVVTYFAWHLLENYETDKEIKNLLNNSALYLVPVVNPDGLVYNQSTNPSGGGTWRKNRKPRVIGATTHYGVDLNRNYGYKWAYTHTGQLGQAGSNFAGNNYYRGTAKWSENETQALRNLCNAHQFVSAFNYHAWDNSFTYPWNFDVDSLTGDSLKFNAIAQYCTEDNNFERGTFDKTLGYTANGTSDDWLYGEQLTKPKIFPFTIEVGKSFWPAQSLILPYCDSLLQANIKMLRMAAKYAAIEETGIDTIRSLSYNVVYNLKRYSIKDTNFTVSVIPLDANITATGSPRLYPAISFLGTIKDSIFFSVDPLITNGTVIRFLLKVDNGTWYTIDTISKVFMLETLLALDCTNRIDSNNSMSHAVRIDPGTQVTGSIEMKTDEDWFYFQNSANQKNIRIVLSGLPADYDMELLDASGQKIAFSNLSSKMNDTIEYNTTQEGTFWIRVYGYKNAYHPFECYFIRTVLGNKAFDKVKGSFLNEKDDMEINFSVFPQPVSNYVNVSVGSNKTRNISWTLSDNTGRHLSSGVRRINKGATVFTINARNLNAGFYVLTFFIAPGRQTRSLKIIKQ